jgi:tripartite ATP-independent transporter DctP family solute receptor
MKNKILEEEKMTRSWSLRACFATVVLAVVAIIPDWARAQPIKFAHVYEVDTVFHKAALQAADEIKRRTGGRLDVQVFPAGSLGREQDLFNGLRLGAVDITYTGSFYAGTVHPPMALSSAPFLFRDFDHWKAYARSDVFRGISEEFEKKSGNRVLGLVYYGARHLTSNKPVRTPDDMRGMKLRVPSTPMYLLFPRSVGANPVPIDFAEVYLALQQGTADGQENPLPTIMAKKFYEVQKFISLTGHLQDSLVILVGPQFWQRLSAEDRKLFEEVFAASALATSEAVLKEEEELAGTLAARHNVTVLKVDREPFREAMMKLTTGPNMPWSKEQIDRVQALR